MSEHNEAVVTGPDDFGAFERWRETGELPQNESESAAAASGEGDGEPEPGGETEKPKESDRETEGESDEDKPRKTGGFQRRIDRLTREKHELAQRLEALEQRLAGKPAGEREPKAGTGERPKSGDFDDYDQYLDALADWKVEQKLAEQRQAEAEQSRRAEQAAAATEWAQRLASFRAATPDFDAALEDVETPLTPAMQQAIVESEAGPQVMYHLARHPEEIERIAKLPPVAAVREIGKIEAKLATTPEKPKPKAASAAPAPVKPLAGGGRTVDLDDPNLPFDEWERRRNAQLAA